MCDHSEILRLKKHVIMMIDRHRTSSKNLAIAALNVEICETLEAGPSLSRPKVSVACLLRESDFTRSAASA